MFTWYVRREFRLPPRLRLELLSDEGEKHEKKVEGRSGNVSYRYYHLRVSNDRRRWLPAENVQVHLIRIEEPGPDGSPEVVWSSDVPMRWRDQEFYPVAQTIGRATDSDLCCVNEDKWFTLLPLFTPYSLEKIIVKRTGFRLAASFQAKSDKVDSPITRVEIAWDGVWESGDKEMKRHLKIKVDEPQPASAP